MVLACSLVRDCWIRPSVREMSSRVFSVDTGVPPVHALPRLTLIFSMEFFPIPRFHFSCPGPNHEFTSALTSSRPPKQLQPDTKSRFWEKKIFKIHCDFFKIMKKYNFVVTFIILGLIFSGYNRKFCSSIFSATAVHESVQRVFVRRLRAFLLLDGFLNHVSIAPVIFNDFFLKRQSLHWRVTALWLELAFVCLWKLI